MQFIRIQVYCMVWLSSATFLVFMKKSRRDYGLVISMWDSVKLLSPDQGYYVAFLISRPLYSGRAVLHPGVLYR